MVDQAEIHTGIADTVAGLKAAGHGIDEIIHGLLTHVEKLQAERTDAKAPPATPAPAENPPPAA